MLPPVISHEQRATRNSGETNGIPVPRTTLGTSQPNLGRVLEKPEGKSPKGPGTGYAGMTLFHLYASRFSLPTYFCITPPLDSHK